MQIPSRMKMLHKSRLGKNLMTQNVFFNLVRERDSLLKALRKSCELPEAPKFRLHLRNAEEILVECTDDTNIH
jgi:hypothetical protein